MIIPSGLALLYLNPLTTHFLGIYLMVPQRRGGVGGEGEPSCISLTSIFTIYKWA